MRSFEQKMEKSDFHFRQTIEAALNSMKGTRLREHSRVKKWNW